MAEGNRARGRAGPSRTDWAVAASVAVLVLLLTASFAQRNRALTSARQEAEDWSVVTELSVAIEADLEAAVQEASSGARRSTVPGVSLSGVGRDRQPAAGSELTPGDIERRSVTALLARAMDSGEPVASTPVELDAGMRLLVVVPSYGPTGVPPTLVARREAIQRWTVSTVDLAAMAAAHLPAEAGARITIGDATIVAGAGAPHADVGRRLELRGQTFDIRAGAPEPPPVSSTTVVILLVGAAVAVVAAAGAFAVRRTLRHQREGLERGESQAHLIAEVAPIVQQSLDLADVLPAIAVQLRDQFGLAGIRVATGTGAGKEQEVFGLGRRPAVVPPPVLVPPDALLAGEALTLALQRGGRSVATLELVAGRDLREEELRSLRVLSELVTAAVVNANLYASQQDAVRRLRDLDALKTVFLSTASHELRTPATAIGGFASLLEQRWENIPDERRREMIERIAANARSLGAVVEDLLDFSLLDRREQPLPTTPTDLTRVVQGVVDRLALLFGEHVIDVRTSPVDPVAGEQNALERVITNLLTNAAKFSPPGTTVSVAVDPAPGGAQLVVCDQGPGVPHDDRARIFTRFYRGSGEAVVQTRGVGIGLSVVSELVARLGGRVDVDDAPGGGARFTVWLPAASPDRADEGDDVATKEVQDAPAT